MSFKIIPMISEKEINDRIVKLGEEITRDYANEDLMLVGILKGSLPFVCSLMWQIKNENLSLDFMCVSSYGSETESSGIVRIVKDLDDTIENKNVLIVEDIVDTGRTMLKLTELLSTRNPKSLRICTLLDKPSRREAQVKIDYTGFQIENKFVVGFGLDYDQHFRELKYIGEVVFDK